MLNGVSLVQVNERELATCEQVWRAKRLQLNAWKLLVLLRRGSTEGDKPLRRGSTEGDKPLPPAARREGGLEGEKHSQGRPFQGAKTTAEFWPVFAF